MKLIHSELKEAVETGNQDMLMQLIEEAHDELCIFIGLNEQSPSRKRTLFLLVELMMDAAFIFGASDVFDSSGKQEELPQDLSNID